MIISGWGLWEDKNNNVLYKAKTPAIDALFQSCPHIMGLSSGMAVGLPNGQVGNAQVGCLNIGAGRIVYQDLTRISKVIQHGEFFENPALLRAIKNCQAKDSSLHLIGLLSDGGVHSHLSHLYALLELAKRNNVYKVYVHCFLDGRDTEERSALYYLEQLQAKTRELGIGEIATCMGRSYAMDRSNKYERIKQAFVAMTAGEGNKSASAEEAVELAYAKGETDEFLLPTVIVNGGVPVGTINDDDSVIFFNFRPDRVKELTHAFCDEEFRLFKREKRPEVFFTTFAEVDPEIENKEAAFSPEFIENNLVSWLDKNGVPVAMITESEGAMNLLFSFSGNSFEGYDLAEQTVVNSPKALSFDLTPEMAMGEIAARVEKTIEANKFGLIVCNFIGPNIMGHIAKEEPLIKSFQALDKCIERVAKAVIKAGYTMFICSDHGNAEQIRAEDGSVMKYNTNHPVPFILVNYLAGVDLRAGGCLADVAPTVLDMMGVPKPKEMTGRSLLLTKKP